jgi:hypothetical protein
MPRHNCFQHLFAFLNTRLRAFEMAGFFSKLVNAAFGRLLPFHRAVITAWCSDENARYHSGLLWLTLMSEPYALRLNSSKSPFGIQLPDLSSLCKCASEKQQWITRKWSTSPGDSAPGGRLKLESRCCKIHLHLFLEENAPKSYEDSGVGYVLDRWPARPRHRMMTVTQMERQAPHNSQKRSREMDDVGK